MDKIIRFSVSLPEKLLEELDKKVDAQGMLHVVNLQEILFARKLSKMIGKMTIAM